MRVVAKKGLSLRVKDDGNPLHACDRSIVVELHNWMFILLSRVNHDLGQHDTCLSLSTCLDNLPKCLAFCRFPLSFCPSVVELAFCLIGFAYPFIFFPLCPSG